jgi:hypothetical protein
MSKVLDPQTDKVSFSPTLIRNLLMRLRGTQSRTSMSRALGAAFLSHQVAELERKAANQRNRAPRGRGGRSGGARRSDRDQDYDPDFDRARAKAAFGISTTAADEGSWRRRPLSSDDTASESTSPPRPRIPLGGQSERNAPLADVIVVDASVLIYALGAVQRWCHDGQTQVVVPLEGMPRARDFDLILIHLFLQLSIHLTFSSLVRTRLPFAPEPPLVCSRKKLAITLAFVFSEMMLLFPGIVLPPSPPPAVTRFPTNPTLAGRLKVRAHLSG